MNENTQVVEESKTERPETARGLISKAKREGKKIYGAEDKIRIVMEGLKKELSIADLCRRERILPSIYYSWLKQFMEGGKGRLKGDSLRNATSEEVIELKKENEQLKEALGEQTMELLLLKKRLL